MDQEFRGESPHPEPDTETAEQPPKEGLGAKIKSLLTRRGTEDTHSRTLTEEEARERDAINTLIDGLLTKAQQTRDYFYFEKPNIHDPVYIKSLEDTLSSRVIPEGGILPPISSITAHFTLNHVPEEFKAFLTEEAIPIDEKPLKIMVVYNPNTIPKRRAVFISQETQPSEPTKDIVTFESLEGDTGDTRLSHGDILKPKRIQSLDPDKRCLGQIKNVLTQIQSSIS